MPIPRKEKKDEVKKLIDEGYKNVEIAEKTGVGTGTVSKWRTEFKKNKVDDTESDIKDSGLSMEYSDISSDSLKKLHDLQGLFGLATLDETIEFLHKEMPLIKAQMFKVYWDFHGSPSEAFEMLVERDRLLREATEQGTRDPNAQGKVLAKMGMSWFPKGLYNLENNGESLVQFLEKNILEHYKEKDWIFNRKSKQQVLRLHPELEGELTGDILSICSPEPRVSLHLPKKDEDYFGVQTEPISDEMWKVVI